LHGAGQYLHDALQDSQTKALLRALALSRFPELFDGAEEKVSLTVILRTRAEDETVLVEWDNWVVGTLSRKSAEIAKSAMRKQGNRTYFSTEVDAELLVSGGDPQVWIDLPETSKRDNVF
jgi:hypothetical protein